MIDDVAGTKQDDRQDSPRTIAVIDGNSLMHRAFHAVPPYMTAPDGRPTNACFGFLSMFLKLADDFKPDAIICAFDKGIPDFRLKAIEEYKAQRPPTDPDLKSQFPMIKELLNSMNIPVVELQGWEGDDILGTLAASGESKGYKTLLVTGDKDALQLTSDLTYVVNTKTGMSDVIIYDPEAVYEKWGVTPAQVPDFLGLMGDSSDNIPGIPGVGPKTATKLLQQYETLEDVLAHADEIKGKLGENMRSNKDQAIASKDVATIRRSVPLDCDLETISFPSFDSHSVTEAFKQLAMMSQLRKVLALIGEGDAGAADGAGVGGSAQAGKADIFGKVGQASSKTESGGVSAAAFASDMVDMNLEFTTPISGDNAPGALREALQEHSTVSAVLDLATNASLFDSQKTLYVATEVACYQFDEAQISDVLPAILESATLVAFDIKLLLQELVPRTDSTSTQIDISTLDSDKLFDLSLAAYLLDSSVNASGIGSLCERYLAGVLPEANDMLPISAIHATAALALHSMLSEGLIADDTMSCFTDIEMPLVLVLLQMEHCGVNIYTEALKTLSDSMQLTISDLKQKALTEAGEEFNLDSPKQLGVILFEKLKLPTIKKTRTGYSTDASVLQELEKMHPLPKIMLEYRELAKLKSTYLDALPLLISKADGHIHTSFNQAVTTTGRLSSSDPNLQNIPVRTDLGREIRKAFIPDPQCFDEQEATFVSADYSQIELRLLAHLSGDEGLIEAFLGGEDFHASTAARVFGVAFEEVTPQLRSRAKAVNFGIVYGQQAYGLSQSLGVSFAEAGEMITRYYKAYPQVRRYLDETIEQARDQGWVATMYGRKRHIHELKSSNPNTRSFGERTAMNHPMQGSAADIIKLAMIEIQRRLASEGFASQMILQIHDELDFNCALSEKERLVAMVKEIMEGVAQLKVPLLVDVSCGNNWAEAH